MPIEQWSAEPVFVKSLAVSPETGLSNRLHHVNDDARVGPLGATIATRGGVPARPSPYSVETKSTSPDGV